MVWSRNSLSDSCAVGIIIGGIRGWLNPGANWHVGHIEHHIHGKHAAGCYWLQSADRLLGCIKSQTHDIYVLEGCYIQPADWHVEYIERHVHGKHASRCYPLQSAVRPLGYIEGHKHDIYVLEGY